MGVDVRALARRGSALAVGLVAALATVAAGGEPVAADGVRSTQTRRIASAVLGRDVTYTLTAVRSAGDPLAASVRLRVFVLNRGRWTLSDQTLVGQANGWFWFPLTGKGAVCQFSTASTDPAPVTVSLLVTPSIGCSLPERFEVRDGKITAGGTARQLRGAVEAGGGAMAGARLAGPARRAR